VSTVPIGSVESGIRARVAGTVRRAGELVLSSLGEKPCVYWEVRRPGESTPHISGGEWFWIEDESGRALVMTAGVRVAALAVRREELLDVVDADVEEIGRQIREIKVRLKTAPPDETNALQKQRKELGRIATLLYTIRAHARGKLHRRGTLETQARWIHAQSSGYDGTAAGTKSVKLMLESMEITIEEGQRVEVDARFEVQPIPQNLGVSGGGYRDLPTCLVARAADGEAVTITGMGAIAPPVEPMKPQSAQPIPTSIARPSEHDPKFARAVIAVLAAVLAIGLLLTWISSES
jgi:hypothetical protein